MIERIGGGFEKTLLMAADKLRNNIDAAFKNNDQLKTNTTLQTCCDGRKHGEWSRQRWNSN